MKAARIPSCVVYFVWETIQYGKLYNKQSFATSVNTKPFSLSKQLQDLSLGPNVAIRGVQSRLNT